MADKVDPEQEIPVNSEPAELSLDPTTWFKPKSSEAGTPDPPASPAPAETADSFDPTTWGRTAFKPQPAAEAPPLPAPAPNRRLALWGLGAGVVLAGAGGIYLFSRKTPTASPSPAASAAPAAGGVRRQVLTINSLDSVAEALLSQGLSPEASKAATAAALKVMNQADGDLRLELAIAPASGGGASLVSLQIRRLDGSGVKVTPQGQAFVASALAAATRKQVRVIHGQMDNQSFYSSAVASGLSDSVIPAFFQAFVYDFDFQREIEPGDVFEAAFEENLNDQSEALGAPNLLYASMTTKAKSRALYAFAPAGAKSVSWFDGAGHANQRSLMKTPVEGARISSTFGMRFHPVLGFTRMHKGTDFATPIGTPVFASGDGKVVFAGLHGDHGNYIQIQHTPTLATAYAHLSKFQDGITVGTQVSQGQQIALSGNSGLSSGPHVHYEVIVNGEQVDSQTYQTGEGKSLAGDDLKAFLRERDRIDAVRATAL